MKIVVNCLDWLGLKDCRLFYAAGFISHYMERGYIFCLVARWALHLRLQVPHQHWKFFSDC